eukprot:TRINITY_DN17645_c0_g1_i8.p1 TRINITY_DN17645_c0_g1~~TRINITY_DN17645_c0_g1_i8.p1  ORF type:complete len:193 (+),score=71.70 TRINITY_DN17645_c0_g1_i8:49-627(+)
MLDGIQDKGVYPSDFFIDLVFKDGEGEMLREDKDKLWVQIAQSCESMRRATDKGNNAVEELKESEHIEAEPEFVIEAPTADDIADDEDKQASSLEQEAIKMHKKILEDDEDKKEVAKSESKKEVNAAKNEEETKKGTGFDKTEKRSRRKGSIDREKKEQPSESKKAETDRVEDEQDLESLLSNINAITKSNR